MTVIQGAPRHVAGAPQLVVGTPRPVAGDPSYSEGRQECPPRVWYSPEIDASKFTLHILSDTPGGFQWLKYIVLMLCNATRCLGNGKRVILCQRVRGSVRAIRAVRKTQVFLTETRVVADDTSRWRNLRQSQCIALYPAPHPALLSLPLLSAVLSTCQPPSLIEKPVRSL